MKSNPNIKSSAHTENKSLAPENPSIMIGRNLRQLREERGITQKDIAKILGVSYQQIQKYECGRNHAPIKSLLILKDYYGVPYELFLNSMSAPVSIPNNRDVELCNQIYEIIKTVRNKKMRDKIIKVVEAMCS